MNYDCIFCGATHIRGSICPEFKKTLQSTADKLIKHNKKKFTKKVYRYPVGNYAGGSGAHNPNFEGGAAGNGTA